MTRLSKADIYSAFERLARVYPTPKQIKTDREGVVTTWLDVLGRVSPDQLERAIGAILASKEEYWPKPGQVRWYLNQLPREAHAPTGTRAEYMAWEDRGGTNEAGTGFAPCPVCGSVPEATGRFETFHDHQRHYEAGVGYMGPRTGPMTTVKGVRVMAPAGPNATTEATR